MAVVGGALLVWQSYQIRKWVMIHEDVIGIIHHVEEIKRQTGVYPKTIDGYCFANRGVKNHVQGYGVNGSGFRLSYFMNDSGITYWYDSTGGFGYYPD